MNPGLIKKYYQMLFAAFVIVASFSFGEGFESEAEMIKKADKLFEQKQYAQALDYYSQLVSLHAEDPNYNYKYGTCLLYASPDKEQALTFLKFAVSKPGVDEMAYYYVARAYHLNYYFKEAIKAYKDFRIKAKTKTVQENDVSLFIKQCEEGKVLIQDIQSINVLSRKDISRAEFFRGYQLNEFDRKILVKPDEFKTKLDKKNKEYSLIVHNAALSEVYYSSYGEKGENGKDLYKMVHFADGTWSTPLSLGPLINTALDEDYPYLHPSGKILYFSSQGHNSIGGYDIFKSELDTLTNLWGAPVNVGFAINSPDDDILYITDMNENVAFFASSRASSKDEITVYKIVPNKTHQDNTVIKGIVSIENSKLKNAQITVTDMETGIIVGVYKTNEKTGAYSITLPSSKQYSFKVDATDYKQMEEIVSIPDKKESPVINQKIELSKTPQEKMLVANQKQTVLDDVAFNQYYKKSADLQVNSDKDVAFNTQVVKEKIEVEPLAKHDTSEVVKKDTKVETTNSSFVEEAYKDARELEKEYQAIQDDAEAAEYVAKIKSEEAAVEKQELIDLSKKLAQTTNPEEKQKIQLEIDQKGKQLRKKTREAVITTHYAEAKKKEAKNKKEEYVAANQYADVIKEATDSKNTDQAIAKLEAQKQKLEQIQERNKNNNQTSLEEAYTETQVSREAEQKNADAAVKKAATDLAAVEEEKKALQKQIDGTKNKQLQEEFKLQIEELNQEIAKKQAEKVIAESDLLAIKTDTDPIPDVKTIQSLTLEVNTVKTKDVGQLTADADKKKDTSGVALSGNPISKTNTAEEKQLAADQYNSEMIKAKAEMDLLVIIDAEKKELENSLASAKKAQKKEIQKKIDELKVAEEKKKLDLNYHLEQAVGIEKKAQLTKVEIAAASKLDEKQVAALQTFSKTGEIVVVTPKEKTQDLKTNPIDTSKTVVAKIDTATNTKSDVKITPIDTARTVTTKIDTTKKNIAAETKTFELKSDFKPEKATEDDVSLAALSAFGIQSDTGFTYGPSNTVKANLNNARNTENEALSLYVAAKAKQEAAAATDKKADKNKLNSEAQDLEKQSQEKQLQASENYFYANRAEYDYNTDVIKRAVAAKKVQVPESKLSDIENAWISSLVLRERVKKSTDFKEKVVLINEAYNKELEVLITQRAIISQIKDIKEIEQQIAAGDVKVNAVAVDTAATKTKTDNAVVSNLPKTEQQIKQEKLNSLQEGFGVVKKSDYEYSKDVAVQTLNKEITALEDSAVAKYNEAVALEEKAETAPKSQAKKLKKQAVKLKRLGRIKEKEALAKTGELHEKENEVNKEKLKKEFLKRKITISDKQKTDIKEAEDAFAEAKKLREQAKKTKSIVAQTDLYNEAYEKETQALEKQQAVLEGGSKEEKKIAEEKRLQEEKLALEKQKEIDQKKAEANKVIARQNSLDSLAKSKVVELTAQIAKEKDPKKKKALQAQAKEYELAADKTKNEALQKEFKEDQLVFENNKKMTEEWKNEKMDPAQQKMISALQKEADSLMKQSAMAKEKALVSNDPAEVRKETAKANDLQNQAIALQEKMKKVKENPSEFIQPADKKDVVVNDKKDLPIDNTTKNPETKNPAIEDNSVTNNTAKKPEEATKQYNELLAEAKKTEKEIAVEIEKYTELKKEAKSYQQQSEAILAQAEGKTNEQEVQKLLNEAARLKKLADQKEDQALQASQLIDNSRLEAAAKRKEAQLYMESLNPQVALEVKKKAVDDNKKTDVFVDYKEKAQKDIAALKTPVNNEQKQNTETPHNTINTDDKTIVKVDVDKAKIFGDKQNPEDAVLKDKFEIKSTVVYSADKPIPVDAKLPEGLVYTVQIGAFKNPIPQDLFKGISPVNGEQTKMGFIRYTAGIFRSFKAAAIARDKIRQMGYPDAFVVPFYNGQRISVDQANQITEKASQQQKNALTTIEVREVEAISKVEVKNIAGTTQNNLPQNTANEAKSTVVNTTDEVFYTVQICVVSKPIASGSPYDLQPLNVEKTTSGLYRYTTGKYKTFAEANARKAEVNAAGIKDAFVTAYKGGQRISAADAQNGAAGTATTNTTVAANPSASGITFKVQIGAYRNEVPVETTTLFFKLPSKVEYYKDADGVTVFTVGEFTNPDDARKLKDQVIAAGLNDAFLVAYQGKEKISVEKALLLINK